MLYHVGPGAEHTKEQFKIARRSRATLASEPRSEFYCVGLDKCLGIRRALDL